MCMMTWAAHVGHREGGHRTMRWNSLCVFGNGDGMVLLYSTAEICLFGVDDTYPITVCFKKTNFSSCQAHIAPEFNLFFSILLRTAQKLSYVYPIVAIFSDFFNFVQLLNKLQEQILNEMCRKWSHGEGLIDVSSSSSSSCYLQAWSLQRGSR